MSFRTSCDTQARVSDALQIVDLEDGKLSDLSQHCGITAENAAVRVHRARKALRRRLEQACGTCAEHGCVDCDCQITEPWDTASRQRPRNA